ncbi:sulfotransferase domain-containing protein [Oscillatoria sp. CS-180]|uniref:sulfotransferase domain-containing protein n=1 Tax=Oscillatoria sp. CS-180 TaxID=3021720 RepID=UPI00232F81DB|nr:sulfotransferase domain-containing protein [Oscillatoria sp. CS-180]MDB9526425.1 sulfotransferase domain-containing protein [Oscillatoria sp. CS-180]
MTQEVENSLPTFLGIGAMRCGTTWLDTMLRSHPEIYLPTRRKEVHFFDKYYERGLDWYTSFFSGDELLAYSSVGEITPAYLHVPEAPERIKQLLPTCKFIAILRNPAERAYSHYGFYLRNYAEKRDFRTFIQQEQEAFSKGLYGQQIERYLQHFSLDQFLLLLYEDVAEDPTNILKAIAHFLMLDEHLFDTSLITQKSNPSGVVQFPRVRSAARYVRDALRDQDLDWIWNLAKSSGLEKMFSKKTSSIPPMSAEMKEELIKKYCQDIILLERLTDLDCSRWKQTCVGP